MQDLLLKQASFHTIDGTVLSDEDILNTYQTTIDNLLMLNALLDEIEMVVLNSIASDPRLPQSRLDELQRDIDGYQSSVQSNFSQYSTTKNTVFTFIHTYQQDEESLERNIVLLQKQLEIEVKNLDTQRVSSLVTLEKTRIGNTSTIRQSELVVESAKIAWENAKQNQDVSLRSLENSITQAQISLQEAQNEYGKLFVRSPIQGKVASIAVDVGQEIGMNTSVAHVVSDGRQEAEVFLSSHQIDELDTQAPVQITYMNEVLT